MVIGTGLIASIFSEFKDSKEVLIFASGVSDSTQEEVAEFQRESDLISKTIAEYPEMIFVYFSTYSVEDEALKDRPYSRHKLAMEELIKNLSSRYLICRLSNIVGNGGNQSNLFNFLVDSAKTGKSVTIWKNATRNLLDLEDLQLIVKMLIEDGRECQTVNIANRNSYSIQLIVECIENHFGLKINGVYEDKGKPAFIELGIVDSLLDIIGKDYSIAYVDNLLDKYYT